jgi:hypothetical protein
MDGPLLIANAYSGSDRSFQSLISWRVPERGHGHLYNLTLKSSLDAKTVWRLVLQGIDQKIPRDKIMTTPITLSWYGQPVTGDDALDLEVASRDGTAIDVQAILTASLETDTA